MSLAIRLTDIFSHTDIFSCPLIYNNKQGSAGVNSEYSVVFKFVSVNQTIIFNAERIAHTFKCVRG